VKVIIAGNGILAQALAFELVDQKNIESIVIVGPNQRLGSATLAAAAMLNSFAEVEKDSLVSDFDKYRFKISQIAAKMWPQFAERVISKSDFTTFSPTGVDSLFDKGTYLINNCAADDLDDENFDAIKKALIDYDEPYEDVAPSDIPNYSPSQKFRAIRALLIKNEGWMNPRDVVSALDQALANSEKVNFIDATVETIRTSISGVDSFVCSDGSVVRGDNFVLANGATLTDLLSKSNLDLPIQRVFYGVGVSLEIESFDSPHTACVRTPNRGLACGVYTAPHFVDPDLGTGRVLIGATNLVSPVPLFKARLGNVESLLKSAIGQINTNFYRAELTKINVGWRPTSQDTQPLLGATSMNNLFVMSGTKRDGFHMAPYISSQMANLICNNEIDKDFLVFNPERPLLKLHDRETAIAKGVRHQMSAAYQHGFTPPTSRLIDNIRNSIYDDLQKLHDTVGAYDWGIPPEMIEMYRYGHATN